MVKALDNFDAFLWGLPLIIVLLGTHLFCTIRTGFIQKHTFKGIKLSVTPDPDGEGEVSQFGALTTALAATIGTGNIIGVATAVASGGPGAVFWMWMTGVLGIATKYMETAMSVKYREQTEDGRMIGGAFTALERGLHAKWLGVLFALFGAIAAFGIGCMTQANSISTALKQNFGLPEWVAGILVAVFTAIVIIGGVKSITMVTEKLVPFMAAFYVIGSIWVMIMNGHFVGEALVLIIKSAFSVQAGAGGLFGYSVAVALRYGCARGLFSNESGMGSAPIVAASAKTRNPVRQSLVSMTGTFWDTVVICLLTGLTLVSSALAHPEFIEAGSNTDTTVLTFHAFGLIPVVGRPIIALSLALFAFSTILGWSYYGERCAEYLCGPKIIMPYKIAFVVLSFVGCVIALNTVWTIADILNGLMVIPNVIGVWLLSGHLMDDVHKYVHNIDEVDPTPIPVVHKQIADL
ncbi:alanine/glycine:cation symporter family protein [Hornefia butyriciproducens]|uniref:Alanine:cation symporter family protein n=1 Tax=Hornefia butyriciproducens TaxID=2652293 RepID=A0A6L5Y4M2_9FIRM|nr:alanine/glycine:cation symporter family protein [Hornefia butyriciproducens]MCI7327832.1 alanine:cation symporter family protein [Clostridiales bacterium]MCI7412960.1 alanine:cation symporter family protein [Clostridiales bacterium]MCI7679738.1 alanine:cation symporter family protein [Clostridiales bacterium]MDD6299788.1 alanine/glycine:cation symporter family protein [Hornefia butyriciproducens]MDY5424164.1 alanine/glycine:cation symporter family protein [Hornefia butyriciproducens]